MSWPSIPPEIERLILEAALEEYYFGWYVCVNSDGFDARRRTLRVMRLVCRGWEVRLFPTRRASRSYLSD